MDNFLIDLYLPTFIHNSFACLKDRGTLSAVKAVQNGMVHCKHKWGEYYILKMDVRKYFQSIDKNILYSIITRKVKDEKVLWLIREIIYSSSSDKGIAIGNYTSSNICKYLFKRS